MKRIEKIENYLKNECEKNKNNSAFHGLSASDIAESLSLKRNNVSTDLNTLYNNNILDKTNTRPVKYFIKNELVPPPRIKVSSN